MRLDHLLSKEILFILYCLFLSVFGDVAQLARASALHAEGREFDSCHLHHSIFYTFVKIDNTFK